MKQLQLGRRIASLRRKHNYTQEDLAEKLGVNSRSLQRLEAGETNPRAQTLAKLSDIFNESITIESAGKSDVWLVLMHLSSIVPIVIVPIMIWVWKRSEDSRISYQGIDVINFQMSMWIYMMIAGSLMFFVIGLIMLPILGILICVVSIKNTLRVIREQSYHYPYTIKFLKHT